MLDGFVNLSKLEDLSAQGGLETTGTQNGRLTLLPVHGLADSGQPLDQKIATRFLISWLLAMILALDGIRGKIFSVLRT